MTTATLLLGMLLSGQSPPSGADLLTEPGKAGPTCKWLRFSSKEVRSPALSGAKVYDLRGSPYGMDGSIEGFTVIGPPTECKLHLSLSLRGAEPGQTFEFDVFGWDPKLQPDPKNLAAAKTPETQRLVKALSQTSAEWQEKGALRTDRWSRLEYDWSVPAGTTRLRVILHNPNKGSIYMSAPHMVSGAAMEPDPAAVAKAKSEVQEYLAEAGKPFVSPVQKAADEVAKHPGPVVGHLLIRIPVKTNKPGEVGHVTFPVPGLCPGQIPLAFRVIQSPGKPLAYRWRQREDKRNWVCDVTVRPGTKGVFVQYEALVLLGGPRSRDMSPPDAHDTDWKTSTACVQVAAPEIQEIAKKLASPGDTPEAYARKVFAFVRDDQGKGAPFKTLDALAGLQCGGSCTNKANLVAALLRAHGMVARTVAHMPTWCLSPLDFHWLTEYWQPGKGWIAVDSSLGRWEPDRRTRMVISVSGRRDEDRSFEPLHERFVMPGAPYMSVSELSPELYPADITEEDALNSADQVARFDTPPAKEARLFSQATVAYRQMLAKLVAGKDDPNRYDRVLKLAKAGKWTVLPKSAAF